MDESTPYHALLGIDWAKNMNGVINLKKQTMILETKSLCVVIPPYLAEGLCYIEPVRDRERDDDIDCSYRCLPKSEDGSRQRRIEEYHKAMENLALLIHMRKTNGGTTC